MKTKTIPLVSETTHSHKMYYSSGLKYYKVLPITVDSKKNTDKFLLNFKFFIKIKKKAVGFVALRIPLILPLILPLLPLIFGSSHAPVYASTIPTTPPRITHCANSDDNYSSSNLNYNRSTNNWDKYWRTDIGSQLEIETKPKITVGPCFDFTNQISENLGMVVGIINNNPTTLTSGLQVQISTNKLETVGFTGSIYCNPSQKVIGVGLSKTKLFRVPLAHKNVVITAGTHIGPEF